MMPIPLLLRAMRSAWYRGLKIYWAAIAPWVLRSDGVVLGSGVIFFGLPIVTRMPDSVIAIGDRVTLCSDSRFTPLGVARPSIIRTMHRGAEIHIGEATGISGAVICAAKRVSIGRGCLLGADVQIVDTDFHPVDHVSRAEISDIGLAVSEPVLIEDNVFIGAGSKILKGVTIGQGSVIGAGSIVTKNIPRSVIAAGNPARVIRNLRLEPLT